MDGCGKSATVATKEPPRLMARLASVVNEHWLALVALFCVGSVAPAGSSVVVALVPLERKVLRSNTLGTTSQVSVQH